jgi:VanZ family protein
MGSISWSSPFSSFGLSKLCAQDPTPVGRRTPKPHIVKPSIGAQLASAILDPRYQRVFHIALLAGLLYAGLYPFNFFPSNQVSWLQGQRGVRFGGYGEVRGVWAAPPERLPDASEGGLGFTVELWVTCSQAGPYINDLLSIYQSRDREPFAVEQSSTDLVIAGVVRNPQGQQKFRHMNIDDVFLPGASRFVTISTSKEATILYIGGLRQKTYPEMELAPENFRGTLLLGQTARAHQEWHGDIRGLAFYPKALTADEVAENYNAWRQGNWQELRTRASAVRIYPLDEGRGSVLHNRGNVGGDLIIPDSLRALHPVILAFPTRTDVTNLSDATLNLIGFVPLGGLLVLYLKNGGWTHARATAAAVGAGFVVSLFIELLQVFLPSRDSSLLDLINNTLGTGLGAWLGLNAWPRLRKMKHASLSRR